MSKNIRILISFLIIALVVLVIGIYLTVRDLTQLVVEPFQHSNDDLRTQVSEILHPTPTILPDPITIINEVRSLARLETIQYSVEKVITAESGQGIFKKLFGDRLIFVAHGVIIAGIDLNKIKDSDIWFQDGKLMVRLPEPEIFSVNLDNKKSYVYDRETGLLTQGDPNLETLARQAAEKEILNTALEDGIVEQAQTNGENFLISLFHKLGFADVVIIQATPMPSFTPSPTP
jgi:hypothetical protein